MRSSSKRKSPGTRSQRASSDGRLTEIHRGVYLVGAVAGEHTYVMAALLACGEGSVLSHWSAASSWKLISYPATGQAWVTIAPERYVQRHRIKTVRALLDRKDIRTRHGMALTSPPRAVFEMAPLLPLDEFENLVAEANFRGLAKEPELCNQLERNRGARGSGAMRKILDLPEGPRRTRSPAERLLLRLLRANSITGFDTNTEVLGYVVDFFWPEARLVVEVDGWDGHSGRTAFERDRLKWARLNASGIRIMPVTGRQLRRDPTGAIERIVGAIGAARVQGSAA